MTSLGGNGLFDEKSVSILSGYLGSLKPHTYQEPHSDRRYERASEALAFVGRNPHQPPAWYIPVLQAFKCPTTLTLSRYINASTETLGSGRRGQIMAQVRQLPYMLR